jgi:hypothetical protein
MLINVLYVNKQEFMLYVFFWVITRRLKIQKPGNYPEENIQHTEHGESLKSRTRI